MTKDRILAEIRRTALSNGGKPLGRERFFAETGIKETDWSGKHWIRWGDAIREAGFTPNQLNAALDLELMLDRLALLVRRLSHFPVDAELRLTRRADRTFPSANTFARFGPKSDLVEALRQFALRKGYSDVAGICAEFIPARGTSRQSADAGILTKGTVGYVYLIKHGRAREFKIGRTFDPIRRDGEIRIELPQQLEPIHRIKTDDPAGVEAYWHRRFAEKRLKNEWFALTPADVQAFKRWKKLF